MYTVKFEIAGPMAMFTNPDSGSTPCSYPVPTWAAVKGMFEAVARIKQAYIYPTHIEICRPIRFERYVTNYGGPLRKSDQISGNNNLQLAATVLVDVCYRAYGIVEKSPLDDGQTNYAHALQEMFLRRLNKGTLFYTPSLGWKEFVPDYFGPPRAETQTDPTVNLTLPTLLKSPFDAPVSGRWRPIYLVNVQVQNGVLYFDGR